MRPARLALAFILGVLGAVWFGQGIGFIGGSFMTGSLVWAVLGAMLAIAAGLLVLVERRRRRAGG